VERLLIFQIGIIERMEKPMSKQYVIYNFINFFYEGDYVNGMPSLTPFHEDAIIFDLHDAESMLDKLHKLGFTGLQIKEYVKGLYVEEVIHKCTR